MIVKVSGVETRLHSIDYIVVLSDRVKPGQSLQAIADYINGMDQGELVKGIVRETWDAEGVVENMTVDDFDETTYEVIPS